MKKIVFIILAIGIVAQNIAQKKDIGFLKFTDNFAEIKSYPYNLKKISIIDPTSLSSDYKISRFDAKKYLGFNENNLYSIKYDYNYDENKISNIRKVENFPNGWNKITFPNYILLIYYSPSGVFYDTDTLIVMSKTFSFEGDTIDSLIIRSQLTRESDWTDFVFLSKDSIRLFKYGYNMENYEIKNGLYYLIDEEKPQTIVEIIDYKIDDTGHIQQMGKPQKMYLKEGLNRYKNYHPESDDPMNKY